ncbi:MAG: Ig-like domain repeat protein [Dehalococcoidales bacterium]|nr:Ig-like domain repeat protein [Dehalococcoidales bacterium]
MKFNKICLLASMSVVLLSCFLMLADGQSLAADDPVKSVITLQQQIVTDRLGKESIALKAKITMEDGYPLSERTISFIETLDFFEKSQVTLGTATTNATGLATITYETRLMGEHVITAKFSGDAEAQPALVTMTFNITDLPSLDLSSPTPVIEKINDWGTILAYGGMGAVLIILLTLLFVVIRGVTSNGTVR